MKDRIDTLIDYTARTESGGSYEAWNPDDPPRSGKVSFGLIQFSQTGGLADLLTRMHEVDPDGFEECFSERHLDGERSWQKLLRSEWVKQADLRAFKIEFEDAGRQVVWQQAQRDEARDGYFLPAWGAAQAAGLTSERAAALCFDAAVQRGLGFLKAHCGFLVHKPELTTERAKLEWLAQCADGWHEGEDRRAKILADPALSDLPFDPSAPAPPERRTLKRGMSGADVEELQRGLNRWLLESEPDEQIAVDGIFGSDTEWLVRELQMQEGLAQDGIAGPQVWEKLAEAGKGGQG